MKVLWFCNTKSNFDLADLSSPYNGGGWVSSLEREICGRVELGICFTTRSSSDLEGDSTFRSGSGKASWIETTRHGVCYYPILDGYDIRRSDRVRSLLFGDRVRLDRLVDCYKGVVERFRPDVIEVFGSEHSFGLVAGCVDVPVVLHIQGVLEPYFNVFLPYWSSWREYIFTPPSLGSIFSKIYTRIRWKRGIETEAKIFSLVHNYIGRTCWDHDIVDEKCPGGRYFEGGEILREAFYEARPLDEETYAPFPLRFVSIISEPPYKGLDVILSTAKILRAVSGDVFSWKVFGNVDPSFCVSSLGIDPSEVGVSLEGVANAETLRDELLSASCYIHPSYIDNSPNSVCEAQILGVPVIASRTGGIPSLVEDGRSGLLFTPGSPEDLYKVLTRALEDELLNPGHWFSLGKRGREVAFLRHDKQKIVSSLLGTYQAVLSSDK